MSTSDAIVPIALLSQTGEPGRHVREALAGAGTPIVYEAHAAQLDRDALEKSGARVVVVNLDADVEAHLEDVYALLEDDRYNVIFNEAQVSAQLSGWEQARWARHLAAKILGANNADPPRPQGAEPVPQRAPAVPSTAAEAAVIVTVADLSAVAADSANASAEDASTIELAAAGAVLSERGLQDALVAPTSIKQVEPATTSPATIDAFYDFGDIERLLAETGEAPAEGLAAAFSSVEALPQRAAQTMPLIDLSAFDDDISVANEVVDDRDERGSLTQSASLPDPAVPEAVSPTDADDALGFGDLDDFAGDADFVADFEANSVAGGELDFEIELASMPEMDIEIEVPTYAAPDLDLESEIADSADEIKAAVDSVELQDLELLDLDWADAPASLAEGAVGDDIVVPPPPVLGSAFAWTLTDVEDAASDVASSARTSVKPSEFGIETMTASEFLAPVIDAADGVPTASSELMGVSLELVPLEEVVAPQAVQGAHVVREAWMDPSATTVAVRKVWVLGASIGGPEAVREFLSYIPQDYPALFLLAQHMGVEFMGLMAQQLTKTSKLTVRTPTHGERVAHGDIVVVPTTHRLRVDAEGVILLEPNGETTTAHSPSIDQVLHDVADRFGAKAGVIVFSGMAEDAAEGSRYLAAKGGKVYVQDPQTCVISSMVDGVLETGVVSFTGSPRELAERLLGERAKSPAKS